MSQSKLDYLKALNFAQLAESFVQNNQVKARIKVTISKYDKKNYLTFQKDLLLVIRVKVCQFVQLDTGYLFHILFIEDFDQRFLICQLQNRFSSQVWQINNNVSQITFYLAHSLWLFLNFSKLNIYKKTTENYFHYVKL